MAGRVPATEALRLILAVVPWIVDHPGTPVEEVAARFGKTEQELLGAIAVINFVGLPPYSPDVLIEMRLEEGRIWIDYADYFSKPLRLSTRQALALLTSADGLLSVPGNDPEGSLGTAFSKVAAAVGAGDGGLEVDLGEASTDTLEILRSSASKGTDVKMEYFSFGRNETTTRMVSPWRVYAGGGEWYVQGWCQSAVGERTFRVDRISSIEDTGAASEHAAPGQTDPDAAVRFRPTGGEDTITLDLVQEARWVVESLPCLEVDEHNDGTLRVTLAVSAIPWLERLLLQVGAGASVVSSSLADADRIRPDAALRLLASYGK